VITKSSLDRFSPPDIQSRNRVGKTAAIVLGLTLIRSIAAAYTPLFKDEAYYWTWSKHLAPSYYDHPPMVALVIRLGTALAGNTQFGIRIFSILLVLPMSWAVYRSAEILLQSPAAASTAAIMLNVTMMVSLGTMIVTPDAPLMVASSFVLLFLVKIYQTQVGAWWLGVGVAVGVALLSKYTAFFFAPIIILWLALSPRLRYWLISPWPFAGALLALLCFLPVIFWNADHEWVSFIKQFSRLRIDELDLHLVQLVGEQIAYATPAVFILGFSGFYVLYRTTIIRQEASSLIYATLWVLFVYFVLHALHENVHPHWLGIAYPAFAIAAGVSVHHEGWQGRWRSFVFWLAKWSVPTSVAIFVLVTLQAQTGVLTGFRRDPSASQLAVGFAAVAEEVDDLRKRYGAKCILTSYYGTEAWMEFYLPPGSCVVQRGERIRWANVAEPDHALLDGKLIYVARGRFEDGRLNQDFGLIQEIAELSRKRGPLTVEIYPVYLLDKPKGEVLDYSRPPELLN
jgi:4-amino-4-deoxy-L-arabinose transferase-like glycosyltransferase